VVTDVGNDDEIKIIGDDYKNCAIVNTENVLLVEGLENWIDNLKQIAFRETFLHVADNKTGAEFLIKRLK